MITTPTVFVLGAGASQPFGFDTGGALLDRARRLNDSQLQSYIQPVVDDLGLLKDALTHTLESSIDAMLETRPDFSEPGKALIARLLLQQEAAARDKKHDSNGNWYRTLFGALEAPTMDETLSQHFTFITYNYDRSLEYCLSNALRVKFQNKTPPANVLDKKIIHLHGRLGILPQLADPAQPSNRVVDYGANDDANVGRAMTEIKIIHEAAPDGPQFEAARDAIQKSRRVVFLGFGFASRNVERLNLPACVPSDAQVYATATHMSTNSRATSIERLFRGRPGVALIGDERQDIYEFLRLYPQVMT